MTLRCSLALEDRLQAGAQRERRLAGPGPPAERDDPDGRVEQQVDRDALLGAAAVHAERVPVAAHQLDLLVGGHPAERGAPRRVQDEPGVAAQAALGGAVDVDQVELLLAPQLRHLLLGEVQRVHAGPAGVDRHLGAVLLGAQADRGGLDPHRQVLGDHGDVRGRRGRGSRRPRGCGCRCRRAGSRSAAPSGRCGRARPAACRPRRRRGRAVQPAVLDPQVVEHAQRGAGEVAELGVVALGLELADHEHRQDDVVLGEPEQRLGVGQQDRGVEHVRDARLVTLLVTLLGRAAVAGGRPRSSLRCPGGVLW